jgi:hypothetical protein
MLTLASGEVMKESFLHEKKSSIKDMIRIPGVFIDIKNKGSIPLRHKHKGN